MITQKTFFIIVLHLLTLLLYGQEKASNDTSASKKDGIITIKNLDIVVYELATPPHDKEGMFPLTRVEVKKNNAKPAFLKFQAGGTETNIRIIDSAYSQHYKNIWDTPPIKRLDFGSSETGLLDISDLPRGTYFVSYMSCNIGGNYILAVTD